MAAVLIRRIFGILALRHLLLAVLCLLALTDARANLIINGGFETTVPGATSPGNHVGTIPPNWTVVEGSAYSNLQVGNASGVGGYLLAPHGGGQFFDGTGTTGFPDPPVHLYQDFTTTVGGLFQISLAWGGRDTGADTGTPSYFAILNSTTNAVLYQGSNINVTPETWTVQNDTTSIYFGPGTYRFQVVLSDPINVDDISLIVVPEPSTYAAGFLLSGLALFHLIRRRHQRLLPASQTAL